MDILINKFNCANNKITNESNTNFLIKLKNKLKTQQFVTIFHNYHTLSFHIILKKYFIKKYLSIIIKKIKYLKYLNIMPKILKNNKITYLVNNLKIDHLILDFNFRYIDGHCAVDPVIQLKMLVYVLKFVKIKKITLTILIIERFYSTHAYDLFKTSLKFIIKKYCNDVHVIIKDHTPHPSRIKWLNDQYIKGFNAKIDKTQTNYHRNFKLKNRLIN